ncbi:MAG: FIG019327: membrane domain, partial [uncultured Nocardioidaceae bacterium]
DGPGLGAGARGRPAGRGGDRLAVVDGRTPRPAAHPPGHSARGTGPAPRRPRRLYDRPCRQRGAGPGGLAAPARRRSAAARRHLRPRRAGELAVADVAHSADRRRGRGPLAGQRRGWSGAAGRPRRRLRPRAARRCLPHRPGVAYGWAAAAADGALAAPCGSCTLAAGGEHRRGAARAVAGSGRTVGVPGPTADV